MRELSADDVAALIRASNYLRDSVRMISEAVEEYVELAKRQEPLTSGELAEAGKRLSDRAADMSEQASLAEWIRAEMRNLAGLDEPGAS